MSSTDQRHHEARRRMMMADDLDPAGLVSLAVTVLENKVRRLPTGSELDRARHVSIVISRERDHFAAAAQTREQIARCGTGSLVVHQIADDEELPRQIIFEQCVQSLSDRSHAPKWDQATRRAG